MAIFDQTIMLADIHLVPSKEAIEKSERLLNRFFENNEGIKARTETSPFFVSAWYDCNQFVCPSCGQAVTPALMEERGTDWFEFLTSAAKASDAMSYMVTTPCCNTEIPLSKLVFSSKSGEAKAAIASFQISVKDIEAPIDVRQLAQLEKVLGCKLIAFLEIWG